jgi:hypothetical protein
VDGDSSRGDNVSMERLEIRHEGVVCRRCSGESDAGQKVQHIVKELKNSDRLIKYGEAIRKHGYIYRKNSFYTRL